MDIQNLVKLMSGNVTSGFIRAGIDVHRIGEFMFGAKRFLIEEFMKKFRANQKHQHRFGIHTFYVITNNSNRGWLINTTLVYKQHTQIGGFYQVIDKTFILSNLDFALVPASMYPKNEDFSLLNIQTMFMWMSSYPELVMTYGLRYVPAQTQTKEYIDAQEFFKDFMWE